MAGPIKPSEITKAKQANIPEEVFEVFNALIAEKWSRNEAKVLPEHYDRRLHFNDHASHFKGCLMSPQSAQMMDNSYQDYATTK